MEVYARELIPALLAAGDGDVRFTAFVSREAAATDGPWREMPSVTVPVRSANRAEWVRGEQALLPRLAAAHRVDLVHSLATTAPGWGRFRRVTTIHDLHYRTIPEAHFGVRALGMRVLVPLSARRSHRVIADSQATRDDVVEFLRVPPARVDVVHLGLGRRARAEPEPFSAGGRRVLLTAAAKRPHKNLAALLDALALLPAERPPAAGPARLPDAARAGAQGARGRARNRGRRALPGLGGRRADGGPVRGRRGVRVPVAVGGLRPAGARGDGPRRARRLLGPAAADRGRGRRRAALRPHEPARDRRRHRGAPRRRRRARAPADGGAGARGAVHLGGAPRRRRCAATGAPGGGDSTPLRSARRRARARSARPRPWPRPPARRRARRPAAPLPRPGVRRRTRTGARRSSSCGRRSR